MYYIVNEDKQIIAADETFLSLCHASNIVELCANQYNNTLSITLSSDTLEVKIDTKVETFSVLQTPLSSLLGSITVVSLKVTNEESTDLEENETDFLILDEKEEISQDTILLDIPEEKEDISLPVNTEDNNATVDIMENLLDIPLAKETNSSPKTAEADNSEIFIDISQISQKIGISQEDYKAFLNEYIDDALVYEKDLSSADTNTRSAAIAKLSHLGFMLSLPKVGDIMESISNASDETRAKEIESFYSTLSRISTTKSELEIEDVELFDLSMTSAEKEIPKEKTTETTAIKEVEKASNVSFGTLDLSQVEPILFDFQIEEAANDLSLPVELIEEFVQDFIEQARIETEKMLTFYEKGDLDAIQKIGHLLKGASSNLRIKPLADTLYNIQFCTDSDQLEELIKTYWGHFLSFEKRIKLISN